MGSFRETLDALIDDFLAGRLSFALFLRGFSKCYVDDAADFCFTAEELDHYGSVHEKSEWTSTSPTLEDREYGWIGVQEFREWLTVHEQIKPNSS